MVIPAWIYFSFCSSIGGLSLYLGIEALDKTDLPASVSPAILFLLKGFLVTAAFHSSTYALMLQPNTRISREICIFHFCLYIISFPATLVVIVVCHNEPRSFIEFLMPLGFLFRFREAAIDSILLHFPPPREEIGIFVHYCIMSVLLIPTCRILYLPTLAFFSSLCTLLAQAILTGDPRLQGWLPVVAVDENGIFSKVIRIMNNNEQVIKRSAGVMGTLLFQNFFRLKSFDQVLPFIYFTVAWLANLALLLCPNDFGILDFLLGNVVLNYTVNEFRLNVTTWIVYAVSILLWFVRNKLAEVSVVARGEGKAAIVAWGVLQIIDDQSRV